MRKVALIFSLLPFLLISCGSDFPDTFNNNEDILEILQGVNTIKITSKNENLILKNAVINRGNCSLTVIKELPKSAKYIPRRDGCEADLFGWDTSCWAISYDGGVSIKHLVDEFPKMLSTGKIDIPLKFGESAEFGISCHAIEVEIDTNIGKRNFSWNAQ